jgi:Raf kinase inhibitor-like YbhB/YbcL family protein
MTDFLRQGLLPLRNHHTSRTLLLLIAISLLLIAAIGCGDGEPEFDAANFDPFTTLPVEIEVRSPDFSDGETIPARLTCDGEDEVPVVSWQRPPAGTQAIAVIFDDPDARAGIFSHWVVFNLPPDSTGLRRGITDGDNGAIEGVNDFGVIGYGGPCPPSGQTHEYRFSVFALIAPLVLNEGASAQDVLTGMRGSVIGYGVLSAMYSRP